MKKKALLSFILILTAAAVFAQSPASLVNVFIGTGHEGNTYPGAVRPFGMVAVSPDTRTAWSGYKYADSTILGFSHTHLSGIGCDDYLDLLFMPYTDIALAAKNNCNPTQMYSKFSHDKEQAEPGYYKVYLDDYKVGAELTATLRGAVHRYTYPKKTDAKLFIDLAHGPCPGGCSIYKDEKFDTVSNAFFRVIDPYTIEGYKISDGWAKKQHVYFYTTFSKPIKNYDLSDGHSRYGKVSELNGTGLKAWLDFGPLDKPLVIKIALSAVSNEGARKNFEAELANNDFDKIKTGAKNEWNTKLSAIEISGELSHDQLVAFYTALYHSHLSMMYYNDVDLQYRGSDYEVHQAKDFNNITGVLGLWDIFRAACPLHVLLSPNVMTDMMASFSEHFAHSGLLPSWTLAGSENLCMLGAHSMPVIADCFAKGILSDRYPALYEAMKTTMNKDTFGVWLKTVYGTKWYKEYNFVPADKEYGSVSKTLEFAYDDWCLAQMARRMNKTNDATYYLKRSENYRNVFDKSTNFMRGKLSDGTWRTPFDAWKVDHHRGDYVEGTAWQWLFFVPQNPAGLANLLGGPNKLEQRLDSLFMASSELHGDAHKGDVENGMIGQYVHGNEPSHHTIYLYNHTPSPWKAQEKIRRVCDEFYTNSIDGICGDDDTGQMSAWLVFSSLGFYPVTHGNGEYAIGAPQFGKAKINLPSGKTFEITATNISDKNKYIQKVSLNGKPHPALFIQHSDIVNGGKLEFMMGPQPLK